jgi:integrase
MNASLVPKQSNYSTPSTSQNETIAQAANEVASRYQFTEYQQRRSYQTLRRQKAGLALFEEYLHYCGMQIQHSLFEDPQEWSNISWGLVEGFLKWQLKEGYAIQSINVRLSTVKTYAKLAMKSGVVTTEVYAQINAIVGYTHKEGIRVDEKRSQSRVGFKKAQPVVISTAQATWLRDQPDTPQGRRDRLMMCLFLDHGLRVGEMAALLGSSIRFEERLLVFYRPKVSKVQKHWLSDNTWHAVDLCRLHGEIDFVTPLPLLRQSLRNKQLSDNGMSSRGITHRVKVLGEQVGLASLSAHDCRHYWATTAAKNGTDPFVLQEAGGWSSLAMPRRYIEENDIANEGIKLNTP